MTEPNSPAEILLRLLTETDACPSAGEVALLAEAYPYLSVPAAMRLRRAPASALTTDERRSLIMRVATSVPGRDTLFRLTDQDGVLLAGFMPPEQAPAPTATDTDSAIDTFLERYGRMSEREEALLEKMIFNPVPDDYSVILEREAAGEAPVDQHADACDRMLDAFLAGQAGKTVPEISSEDHSEPVEPAAQPESPAASSVLPVSPRIPPRNQQANVSSAPRPASSLSESLAQVYIKRGRYDKAYDIIHALSLNNPKKSIYFADQLRFLQKLMLIQRRGNPSRQEPR